MIDRGEVVRIRGGGLAWSGGFRVAVVEEKRVLGGGFHLGQFHPDEGLVEQAVVGLHMVGQFGFAVGGDEADVAAVLAGAGELEAPLGQAHQHGGFTGGAGDVRGVEGDFLAQGPFLVPPLVLGVDETGEQEDGCGAAGDDPRGLCGEVVLHWGKIAGCDVRNRPSRGR